MGCQSTRAPKEPTPKDQSTLTAPNSDNSNGLELFTWATGVDGVGVARVLAAYEGDTAGNERTDVDRLRQAGFRAVWVPIDKLGGVLRGLPPRGAMERNYWTQSPEWRALCAGPVRYAGEVAWIGGRVKRLSTGQPRLLARAWTEPIVGVGGLGSRYRVELIAQQGGRTRTGPRVGVDAEVRRGRVLGDLSVQLHAGAGWAIVLVGDDPGADWAGVIAAADAAEETEADEEAPEEDLPEIEGPIPESAPEPESEPEARREPARLWSFGEVVLNQRDGQNRRRIVVLRPHLGGHPTLLP